MLSTPKRYGSKILSVEISQGYRVYRSYQTVIAICNLEADCCWFTTQKYSTMTSRHLNLIKLENAHIALKFEVTPLVLSQLIDSNELAAVSA